jgi:hypothetical protein
MPERQPTLFNLIAAETILDQPSRDVRDPELGDGIEFTIKRKTLRIFPGAVQFTIRTDREDITPDYGPTWVGGRGTAEGVPLVFALSRGGEVVLNNRAPRPAAKIEQVTAVPPQADAEVTDHQLPDTDTRAEVTGPQWTPPEGELDPGVKVSFTGLIETKPYLIKSETSDKRWYHLLVMEHHQGDNGQAQETEHVVFISNKLTKNIQDSGGPKDLPVGREVLIHGYRHEPDPAKDPDHGPYTIAFYVGDQEQPRLSGRGGARQRRRTTPRPKPSSSGS